MSFVSGDGATDASDEVRAGVAEGVGYDSGRGEVITDGDYGEISDETVAVRITLAGVVVGDVDTPLMVGGVSILRCFVLRGV